MCQHDSHKVMLFNFSCREREAMRRQKGLGGSSGAAGGPTGGAHEDPVVGRCCLRPGNPTTEQCDHHEINFEIRESHRRTLVTCTAGCTMPYHHPRCWRKVSMDFKVSLSGLAYQRLNQTQSTPFTSSCTFFTHKANPSASSL